jgi:hypothetical protein
VNTPFEFLAETPLSALSPTARANNARIWELETAIGKELSAPIWNTAKAQKRIAELEKLAMASAESSPEKTMAIAKVATIPAAANPVVENLKGRALFVAAVRLQGQNSAAAGRTKTRSNLKGREKFLASVHISTI